MQSTVPPDSPRAGSCADPSSPAPSAARRPVGPSIFPPRDADEQTHRAFVAASPWPEVVFASARYR